MNPGTELHTAVLGQHWQGTHHAQVPHPVHHLHCHVVVDCEVADVVGGGELEGQWDKNGFGISLLPLEWSFAGLKKHHQAGEQGRAEREATCSPLKPVQGRAGATARGQREEFLILKLLWL